LRRSFPFETLNDIFEFIRKVISQFQLAAHLSELFTFLSDQFQRIVASQLNGWKRCDLFTKMVNILNVMIRIDFQLVSNIADLRIIQDIMKYIKNENAFMLPAAICQYFIIVGEMGIAQPMFFGLASEMMRSISVRKIVKIANNYTGTFLCWRLNLLSLIINGNYDMTAIEDGRKNGLFYLFACAMQMDDLAFNTKSLAMKFAFAVLEKVDGATLMCQGLADYFLEMLVEQLDPQSWLQDMVERMLEVLLGVVSKVQAEAEGTEWLRQKKETLEILMLIDQMEEKSQVADVVGTLLRQIVEESAAQFE
jgi:hypothetical protein